LKKRKRLILKCSNQIKSKKFYFLGTEQQFTWRLYALYHNMGLKKKKKIQYSMIEKYKKKEKKTAHGTAKILKC
jgi:hypothetical protein